MNTARTVSLEDVDWEVITAMQKRTRKNVSRTLSLIIKQWARINREMQLQKEIIKQEASKEIANMKRAKVIKQ